MHVTVTWSKQRSSWGWLVRENFQETLVPGTTDYDVSIKSEIIVHCRHFKGTYISEDFLNALPNLLTLSNTTYSSTNIYQKPADFQVFLLLHLSSSVQKQENPSRLFQTLKKTKSLTLTSVISPVNWHLASSFREKKKYAIWLHFLWLVIIFSFKVPLILQILLISIYYTYMSTTTTNETWQINYPD